MRELLIGSRAALRRDVDLGREPKDWDYIADHAIESGDVYWDKAFEEWLPDFTCREATLDELYTLKISHSAWELKNGSWAKHMSDAVKLKQAGAVLDTELYKLLYGAWERLHGKKVVDLSKPSGGEGEEVWLPYPDCPRYMISNMGRVRGPRDGVLAGTRATSYDYRQYHIEGKTILGHVLVARTFIGPMPSDMEEIRHLDGNGQNNRVSNLMYGTKRQNAADKERHGTNIRKEAHPLAKLTQVSVDEIRAKYARGDVSQRALAAEYGVAQSLVGRVINHQSWKEEKAFFEDAVKREFLHDSIHYSVAYNPGQPMYEQVLKDGQSVEMDMRKIKALPFEECVKLYREEVYTTALERIVIPSDYTASPRAAYAWALRRTITSLTKGWSSMWMADHYEIFRTPDIDYVAHHLSNKKELIPA